MSDKCITCARQTHNMSSIEFEVRLQVRKLNNPRLGPTATREIKTRVTELKQKLQSNRDRITEHQKTHS